MGGKIWTDGEETVFWGEVAILAPPGHDSTSQKAKSHSEIEQWEPLADKMKREMLTRLQPGEVLRRTYTAISCYEHYFQNYVKEKYSPNARPHVKAYANRLKKDEEKNERDATESSGAPTPAGPAASGTKPAGPKSAVASKKRKAGAQSSGHQEGQIITNDLDRMNHDLQQLINAQGIMMDMPFPTATQQDYDGTTARKETQETTAPANPYGWAANIQKLNEELYPPWARTPASQPYTAPSHLLPVRTPETTNNLGEIFADMKKRIDNSEIDGDLGQYCAVPTPSLQNQGYFGFGPGSAAPGQANVGFLDPALPQYVDPAALANPTVPQPAYMQQYGPYQFGPELNGWMLHGYQPPPPPQPQNGEMMHGYQSQPQNGGMMHSHQDQQQQEDFKELAKLAAYTRGDGSNAEHEKDNDQSGKVESGDDRPSKRRRLHD